MKIAFIYDAVYPWLVGGVEKRIHEISRRLATEHEVHIFGMRWWKGERIIEKDGVYLHGVCKPLKLYASGRRSIVEAIYFAWELLFPLMKEKFDVIDSQEFPYFPCFSAKIHSILRNSNLIITWHELWEDYWYEYLGKMGFFGEVVEKIATKLTDKNIAVSNKTKKNLERIGLDNVVLIPNGVDFKKISKVKIFYHKKYDIIFVGRLIKDKNIDILLKTVSLLKQDIQDIKCCILGDGPERERLIKFTHDLELCENVEFVEPFVNHDDVIALIKSSKIFVTPSTREGFGIAALEANACGLPVVTVKHERNIIKEMIFSGKNGFLCNLSKEDLANKIMVAMDKYKRMKHFCINFAKNYDWDKIVKHYNTIIKYN